LISNHFSAPYGWLTFFSAPATGSAAAGVASPSFCFLFFSFFATGVVAAARVVGVDAAGLGVLTFGVGA